MKILVTAVSILALAATPALAQGNGNGNGNGSGNRGGNSTAQAGPDARGNGNDRRNGAGNGASQERGQAQRGNGGQSPRAGNGNNDNRNGPSVRSSDRGNPGNGNRNAANRNDDRSVSNRNGNNRANSDRGNGDLRNGPRRQSDLVERVLYRESGLVNGCPPGLAAKRNGCTPPGQLRQQNDRYARYSRYAPSWWGLPYRGGNYFYEDGFLVRYDGNRIAGYIPLLGGALGIGNVWPSSYGYDRVPDYYSRYYGFADNYRYADNVVYRVDPETAVISSIAALLTGDEFVVGQPVPRGYDVYNVPYSYRDQYRDGPDRNYRYSDGYIYQVDPETQLIAAAIELLV
ncbi:MAG: hypothetical protein JY451_02370 [Erythrobacter sp.]|nr:MAG: hypothetical protein JY451_02370 [Erythrobacter sp.]